MVSKVAVIAIVAILAVPILLGYALNVEQVIETDYKPNDDSINTTQLLETGTFYTYAQADAFKLNTDLTSLNQKVIPLYQHISSVKSSYPLIITTYTNQSWVGATQGVDFQYFYEEFDYDPATANHQVQIYELLNGTEQVKVTTQYFKSIYYDRDQNYFQYQTYNTNGSYTTTEGTGHLTKMVLTTISGKADVIVSSYSSSRFADFSAGFKFTSTPYLLIPGRYTNLTVNLPDHTRSVLLTVNLSSITDSTYNFPIGTYMLSKTTTAGIVKWTVSTPNASDPIEPFDLYYDQETNNNTYQIKFYADDTKAVSIGSGMVSYPFTAEFRYVGSWPSLIGEANYYQSYTSERTVTQVGSANFNGIGMGGRSPLSPIVRVDAAEFVAFETPIIENKTYDPAAFKTNPATIINDPALYGASFTFGGNTYTVKNGNITMGTHDIPVKGLVLSSVPNPDGGYDNKIGNTVISTTEDPSTITFNGKWAASISTSSQEEYEITKTEWKAGSFAWDGIDQNFLMVGLLASLGAFIALGIYARRSRASIWPLLIVCGGAALLFFVML